ncbi:MAG: DivIVA domain-containing protein [Ignavibacteria bacterium]|nr:DivIVA domain-containing protein [Ignavibacteria bacterium]
MKFTPFGIKNQEFNKSVRGYDREEVRNFLENLAEDFERLNQENEKLKNDIERLDEQMKEYKRIEKNLQTAMLSATESTSKAIDSAKKQTALMLKEAELKAVQIIEKAKESANAVRESVLKLREERKLLIARIKAMIESQADLLEFNIENIDTRKQTRKTKSLDEPKKEEQADIDVNDILEKLL